MMVMRTQKQQSLIERCAADSRKTADELVRDQRDVFCRIAVALGKHRENWDAEELAAEVDVLRIRAETLVGIVRRFATMITDSGGVGISAEVDNECQSLLASAERWAP